MVEFSRDLYLTSNGVVHRNRLRRFQRVVWRRDGYLALFDNGITAVLGNFKSTAFQFRNNWKWTNPKGSHRGECVFRA